MGWAADKGILPQWWQSALSMSEIVTPIYVDGRGGRYGASAMTVYRTNSTPKRKLLFKYYRSYRPNWPDNQNKNFMPYLVFLECRTRPAGKPAPQSRVNLSQFSAKSEITYRSFFFFFTLIEHLCEMHRVPAPKPFLVPSCGGVGSSSGPIAAASGVST